MTKNLQQLFPLFLTSVTFLGLCLLLFCFISFLNVLPLKSSIVLQLRITDILVGLIIYLKTSVDFAIFIGNLMSAYLGIKNRIAIEIGTALGNAGGTFFVLIVWTLFKEVPLLMIAMICAASLVLFSMAGDGLNKWKLKNGKWQMIEKIVIFIECILKKINTFFHPVVRYIIPHARLQSSTKKTFLGLLLFSFTIPLILGLDDFAGYIPLFSVVNIFGFSIGVFLGHMFLNASLFAFPSYTIRVVRQPLISLLGSLAFIGIGLWGLIEVVQILQQLLKVTL